MSTKGDPTGKVEVSDNWLDIQSASKALAADTPTTLATILANASADARGVQINPGSNTVHYNPTGAATTNHGILTSPQVVPGDKTVLDTIQLIGASGETPTVSVVVFGTKQS